MVLHELREIYVAAARVHEAAHVPSLREQSLPVWIGAEGSFVPHYKERVSRAGQRHIHAPQVLQKSDSPIRVSSHRTHDDDILLSPLVAIYRTQLQSPSVDVRAKERLELTLLVAVGREDPHLTLQLTAPLHAPKCLQDIFHEQGLLTVVQGLPLALALTFALTPALTLLGRLTPRRSRRQIEEDEGGEETVVRTAVVVAQDRLSVSQKATIEHTSREVGNSGMHTILRVQ